MSNPSSQIVYKIVLFIALSITSTILKAQNLNEIEIQKQNLLNDNALKNASWSYVIKEVKSNKTVAQHNAMITLVPASTTKIVSTITAYDVLGKQFQTKTVLGYSGKIDAKGELNGNIYIKGGGDPTLGSAYFGQNYQSIILNWYKAIKDKGIKKINGKIIQDTQMFDEMIPDTWAWYDIANYYAPTPSALSMADNSYTIFLKSPMQINVNTEIEKIMPPIDYIKFYNNTVTAKENTGDNTIIYGAPFSDERLIEGTIPANKGTFKIKGSMPDPPYFVALTLYETLKKNGIDVTQECTKTIHVKPEELISLKNNIPLETIASPKLSEIIKLTNHKSINLYAENVLRLAAFKIYGKGSTANGIKAIKNYCKQNGINANEVNLHDGSGISPKNQISTNALTDILISATTKDFFDDFFCSLPSPTDETSTLKRILQDYPEAHRIKVKSGYITGVRAYAGYFTNKNDKLFAFAIIFNNYNCTNAEIRKKIEEFMKAMINIE